MSFHAVAQRTARPPTYTPRCRRSVITAAGFITDGEASAIGSGKVLRKYASTALRTLQPTPPLATDAILDARHLHRRAVWQANYSTQPDPGLAARWAALSQEVRSALTPEAIVRL